MNNPQEAAQQAFTFIANINWANPTWDLFILIFFVVAAFVYGMSLGRDRIIVILVSIYMSLAVVNYAPFLSQLREANVGVDQFFVFKIGAFLGVFILLFFFASRSALMKTIAVGDALGSWWQVILFSFLQVGLLISIVLSFLPKDAVSQLAPLTKTLFADDLARFLWVIAPVIAMMFVREDEKDLQE